MTDLRFSRLGCSDILPEVFQAIRSAEERRKVRRIDHYDVSCTLFIWRQLQKTIELSIARSSEWMWTIGVYRLTREYLHGLAVIVSQGVVR